MKTAKLFRHGGSQAVRLPKEFRFPGDEVTIERRGEEVVLRPSRKCATLVDCVREMQERYPGEEFPAREQPAFQQERDLDLDR